MIHTRAQPRLTEREAPGRAVRVRCAHRGLGERELRPEAPPGAREGALPVPDHRPLDLKHQLAPRTPRRFGRKFVGEPGPTDEGHPSVGEQQLSVITQQVREPLAGRERVEEAQFHPGGAQAAAVGAAQTQGAEAIEQYAHAHTAGACGAQGRNEARRQRAGGDQIHLQQHVAVRAVDGGQHAREELRVLVQEVEGISRSPRPAGGCKLLRLEFRA